MEVLIANYLLFSHKLKTEENQQLIIDQHKRITTLNYFYFSLSDQFNSCYFLDQDKIQSVEYPSTKVSISIFWLFIVLALHLLSQPIYMFVFLSFHDNIVCTSSTLFDLKRKSPFFSIKSNYNFYLHFYWKIKK